MITVVTVMMTAVIVTVIWSSLRWPESSPL